MTDHNAAPSIKNYVQDALAEKAGSKVSAGQHYSALLAKGVKPLLRGMAALERAVFDTDDIEISAPVYVCGLARSGTTILLELLSDTEAFATHRYRDYPYIDVPVLWNKWQDMSGGKAVTAQERAHLDNIMVTPDSPEAFEEMIWMEYFRDTHDPLFCNVLNARDRNQKFDDYYRAHIQKLLFVRNKKRYLAKGNYNLTRLSYLTSLFPDARFVVPIRKPEAHIASLMKQHLLFCEMEKHDPRALTYMNLSGHYEFGLGRVPINTGDDEAVATIMSCWESGEEVKGWALYWAMLHDFLAQQLGADKELKDKVLIVDYDALCANPEASMKGILGHCGLSEGKAQNLAAKIKAPSYYSSGFSEEEQVLVRDLTQQSYARVLKLASNAVR